MSSTRSKRKTNTLETVSPTYKRVENSWVLLVKDSLLDNRNFRIITLPHPGHGKPSKFCLDNEHKKIYEVVTFDETYRSWFIGETVKSDGSLLICSPINPVFIVLPRLEEQCSNKAIPLENLLAEKGFDLLEDFLPDLSKVADLKGPAEIKAYKYNEEKTLSWLHDKVNKLSKVLKEKHIHVRSGAMSATFVASHADSDPINEEFYLKYAFELIAEYLPETIMNSLEIHLNFSPNLVETLAKKRKSEANDNSGSKKLKTSISAEELKENNFSNTESSELKKPKTLSAKEKARQKAASGTKTISSFFSKK